MLQKDQFGIPVKELSGTQYVAGMLEVVPVFWRKNDGERSRCYAARHPGERFEQMKNKGILIANQKTISKNV